MRNWPLLRESRLQLSVEKHFRLVLASNHHKRAQILPRFQKSVQCGRRSGVKIEFVVILIAAASHR